MMVLKLYPSPWLHDLRLEVLDAEDRLSIACEKGFTEDPVTLQLRKAFQVRCIMAYVPLHFPCASPFTMLTPCRLCWLSTKW